MEESGTYIHAPNKSIRAADGITYAYRELGRKTGIPIVFFTHLSANLDDSHQNYRRHRKTSLGDYVR